MYYLNLKIHSFTGEDLRHFWPCSFSSSSSISFMIWGWEGWLCSPCDTSAYAFWLYILLLNLFCWAYSGRSSRLPNCSCCWSLLSLSLCWVLNAWSWGSFDSSISFLGLRSPTVLFNRRFSSYSLRKRTNEMPCGLPSAFTPHRSWSVEDWACAFGLWLILAGYLSLVSWNTFKCECEFWLFLLWKVWKLLPFSILGTSLMADSLDGATSCDCSCLTIINFGSECCFITLEDT